MTANSPRERLLAIVALTLILTVGGGFVAYTFFYLPLRDRDRALLSLESEIQAAREKLFDVKSSLPKLKTWQAMSLPNSPADPDMARREYERELGALLRASDFSAGSFTVVSKPADSKSSPLLPGKKPVYTKLGYTIQARGDLNGLVDFLDRFYRVRLLHQIKNVTVQRTLTTGSNAKPGELDINLSVEALVLDTGEKRKELQPDKSVKAVNKLALPDRDYSAITGKNVFFGTPPKREERPADDVDIRPFVYLTDVTENGDGRVATLYDRYHNYYYEVRRLPDETFRIQCQYFLNGKKKSLGRSYGWFTLQQDYTPNRKVYEVLSLAEGDLVLRATDERTMAASVALAAAAGIGTPGVILNPVEALIRVPDRTIRLHVGENLAEATPLRKAEPEPPGRSRVRDRFARE